MNVFLGKQELRIYHDQNNTKQSKEIKSSFSTEGK